MTDCIFCRIGAGEIKARIVYQDEWTIAFHDVNPQAPTHILVVPKKHFRDIRQIDAETAGHLFDAIKTLATELALGERGFRTVFNTGVWAGQTVDHVHAHLLGGKPMGWPPFPA